MKCREAERALRNLGFLPTDQGGTSHVHWKMIRDGVMRKVTLDCHRGEVRENDVRSMIGQAGVSKEEWWRAAADLKD